MIEKSNDGNPNFINKYGPLSVSFLLLHLQTLLENKDLNPEKKASIKEQINFLKSQRETFYQKEKKTCILKVVQSIDRQSEIILQQFSRQWKKSLTELRNQMREIDELMGKEHRLELQRHKEKLHQQYQTLQKSKGSKRLYELSDQKSHLSKNQEYFDASNVQKMIEREEGRLQSRKFHQWKSHRTSQMKALKGKQEKEKEAMHQRLQRIFDEEIEHQSNKFQTLVAKLKILRIKYEKQFQQGSYDTQLRRIILGDPEKISKNSSMGSTKVMQTPQKAKKHPY